MICRDDLGNGGVSIVVPGETWCWLTLVVICGLTGAAHFRHFDVSGQQLRSLLSNEHHSILERSVFPVPRSS